MSTLDPTATGAPAVFSERHAVARPDAMPSITASALEETLRLVALTRRAVATWLVRS